MAKEVLELEVKSNIGEVSKGIDKATKSVGKLADEAKKVDGATKTASTGFKGMGTAIKGMGMALKAAGIGLIIALFVALKEAVERNQKAMDLLETVTSTISTTFNQVVTVLTDVVKWVTESSDRFDGLGKVLSGIATLALAPLQLAFYNLKLGIQQVMLVWEASPLGGGDKAKIAELGESIKKTKDDILAVGAAAIDAGKDIVNNIGDAINEVGAIYEKASDGISKISIKANYEQAGAATAATKAAKFAAAEFARLNAEKLRESELIRQIINDETKTFEERIKANKDLKKSLEEQHQLQSDQIQIQITAAALALQQNGNDDNRLALMEAQNAQLELEKTITGQLSEQKKTQVSLEKELLEIRNDALIAGLEGVEKELAEAERAYQQTVRNANKAGIATVEITRQYQKEKFDIIDSYINKEARSFEELSKNKVKWSQMTNEEQLNLAIETAGNLSQVLGEETKAGKAAAIVQATISTYQGATQAYTSMSGIPYVGPVLGGLAAAAAVASGLANVKAIIATGDGGGAVPGGVAGGGAPPPATSTPSPQMMSGAFDISGGVAPEAMKAFVVTDEMSNSQNQLANIRRRATI